MKDHTKIIWIIDKSGSMIGKEKETITSFNEMLQEQKSIGNNADLTVVMFDSIVTTKISSVPILEVQDLTLEDYTALGTTALWDAIGQTITSIGASLKGLPENERPNKVAVFVVTDGMDNQSKQYTQVGIKQIVTHQKEKYSWHFEYFGADPNVSLQGTNTGFVTSTYNSVAESYSIGGATLRSLRCNS